MTNFEKTSVTSLGAGVFLFVALILLDQLAKHFSHNIFFNSQFAFSLPVPSWLMYGIYALVLVAMIVYCLDHYRQFTGAQATAWVMIFAGAVSNIGERLVLGYVRDFIHLYFYRWVGVYNLADFYILGGVALLLILPMLTKHTNML